VRPGKNTFTKGQGMTTRDSITDRLELLKWISERNTHIPISDLEFLMGIAPFGGDTDATAMTHAPCLEMA